MMKREMKNNKENFDRCLFLLIMTYLSFFLLSILNIYIGYTVIKYFIGDGFSFLGGLFIAFSFVITIPALVFSIKNIRWIKEDKKHKRVFPIIISILGILTGLVLHNATGLWIYILLFSLLLFLSGFFCKKKTKIDNSNVSTLILAITLTLALSGISTSLSAQTNNKKQEIYLLDNGNVFSPYIKFASTDIKDYFNPENSSKYPSTNLVDGNFNTCWVANPSKNKMDTLYFKLPTNIALDEIILNIFSGYGKSKSLYYANARPRKIKLSFYAAYINFNCMTEVVNKFSVTKYPYERIIPLADTFGVQSFPLNLNKSKLLNFIKVHLNDYKQMIKDNETIYSGVILRIEITDTYPGTKYDDVCASEIFFNDRFVTPYPIKYNEVKNVYIKNENILLADYANGKGVVIYKDTSSVFTMVDWIEHRNFAILHYVPNDAVRAGSRITERSSLIDLKNRKIVDTAFKRCTGHNTMFGILKKKDGRIFIENIDEYDIELK
jgi:hypothetical protein